VHRRLPTDPDTEVLPDALAARVLARASELDAAFATGTVANLRSAAVEAGISSRAFDTALAEVRAADKALDQAPVVTASARTRSRGRRWVIAVGIAAATAFASIFVTRMLFPADAAASAGVPLVEERFLLRCLWPGEAAELIRPLLVRSNAVYSPGNAPRVLVVRATPEKIEAVRLLLDRHEGVGSTTCAVRPAPPTAR
jgi:hypothetical protein